MKQNKMTAPIFSGKRDPLAILIRNRQMAGDKLDYMPARRSHSGGHYNLLQPHWELCDDPIKYKFSSAKFKISNRFQLSGDRNDTA